MTAPDRSELDRLKELAETCAKVDDHSHKFADEWVGCSKCHEYNIAKAKLNIMLTPSAILGLLAELQKLRDTIGLLRNRYQQSQLIEKCDVCADLDEALQEIPLQSLAKLRTELAAAERHRDELTKAVADLFLAVHEAAGGKGFDTTQEVLDAVATLRSQRTEQP